MTDLFAILAKANIYCKILLDIFLTARDANFSFIFMEGFHILHNDCLSIVLLLLSSQDLQLEIHLSISL